MKSRTHALICLACSLALPLNAAQAGILKDAAKVVKLSAAVNGNLLKAGLKGGAKLAKTSLKANAILAKCAVKAATSQPCF